ncbi:MAG: FMNH2-dependent alkanesulfonate monooxygenase [Campylobacteraceae bacterium]|jgi:alkanesulfonate monooxygenase|nr:FMNH2-dependent alkanesulfonate monooxygenase [Campylobacteraceae bacterium]
MSLSVFWFLPTGGDSRYLHESSPSRPVSNAYLRQIAITAEQFGYDGILIPTGSSNLDPFITAASLATVTSKIKLLVALRTSATGGPTVLARQAATLDDALNGRLILNVVPGAYAEELEADGVSLTHDERYELADEFLTIYKKLLSGERVDFKGKYFNIKNAKNLFPSVQKPYPPLYFGGSSDVGHELAAKHIDAYLTWGEPLDAVAAKIADVKKRAQKYGRSVRFGLRIHVIVRESEEEAWAAADKLIGKIDDETIQKALKNFAAIDSVGQQRITELHKGDKNRLKIAPNLWAGIGLVRRGAGTALVGNPEQVAARLKEYVDLGIDTFVLSGYPHLEEAARFAELVFPLLPGKAPTTTGGLESHIFTGSAFSSRFSDKGKKAS